MNKKGFVLVETIITSVFVLGLFAFLVANIIPLVGDYDRTKNYDSIESIYDAHQIKKMILKSDETRVANLVNYDSTTGYRLLEGTDVCLFLSNINYCKMLLSREYLDVQKIIVTDYTTEIIKTKVSAFDRATREYIKYMPEYNKTETLSYMHQNRLIIVFNDGRIANVELLFDSSGGSVC